MEGAFRSAFEFFCPELCAPTNGDVEQAGRFFLHATYLCDFGYELAVGDNSTNRAGFNQTCQSDGTYSGVAPECVAVAGYCPNPEAPVNGSLATTVGTAGQIGSRLLFECEPGFELLFANGSTVGRDWLSLTCEAADQNVGRYAEDFPYCRAYRLRWFDFVGPQTLTGGVEVDASASDWSRE
eukprot:764373_1